MMPVFSSEAPHPGQPPETATMNSTVIVVPFLTPGVVMVRVVAPEPLPVVVCVCAFIVEVLPLGYHTVTLNVLRTAEEFALRTSDHATLSIVCTVVLFAMLSESGIVAVSDTVQVDALIDVELFAVAPVTVAAIAPPGRR